MIDLNILVMEELRKQRQKELEAEESRRLWLPLPIPEIKNKEVNEEPKRVIVIDL